MLLKQPGKPQFDARGSFCGDVWGLERYCITERSLAIDAFEQCFSSKGHVFVEMFVRLIMFFLGFRSL